MPRQRGYSGEVAPNKKIGWWVGVGSWYKPINIFFTKPTKLLLGLGQRNQRCWNLIFIIDTTDSKHLIKY